MRVVFRVLVLAKVISAFRMTTANHQHLDSEHSQPNPPAWPASVSVFGPEDHDISNTIEQMTRDLNDIKEGHFSNRRLALLFKPGEYWGVSVKVGYYTQVLGLGERADDVVFKNTAKGIHCPAMGAKPSPGSLDAFWRSAENFKTEASEGMMWAVSQAAPLRRVHVAGNLELYDPGAWASGGYVANMLVDGQTHMGTQQQWMSRNSDLGSPDKAIMRGQWNTVFVGCRGAPSAFSPVGDDPSVGITNEPETPVIAEKPFITIDHEGKYWLQIPAVKRMSTGNDAILSPSEAGTESVPFSHVFVATEEHHGNGERIQHKLDAGLHVVLAPGVFHLTTTLTLKHAGQVLLGIGMATLHPPVTGGPCVRVNAALPNVRVAGLMLGASHVHPGTGVTALLEWGTEGTQDPGDSSQPGIMSDIFARVGGPDMDREVGVDKMVRVHSGHVVGDNLWLWRADHAQLDPNEGPQTVNDPKKFEYHLVVNSEYPSEAGLEVIGNDVTMYGLFVEHTLGHMTQWRGEGGQVFFYQSELPYDVTQGNYGDAGYAGYMVADGVQTHQAHGIGVYTYFRDHEVRVDSAIRAPEHPGVRFTNVFTRFLNGHGGIWHVLNGQGGSATVAGTRMARIAGSAPAPAPAPGPAPAPVPGGSCKVGDNVECTSSGVQAFCGGNQCCPDGSACPSAEPDFNGCRFPKGTDCTR